MEKKLLSRNNFRESVFERDSHKCCICGVSSEEQKLDAHHIMERRLFVDGGYYLDNGASLCSEHHLQAESTKLTCEEIREACGITRIVLPEHLYGDQRYDKWGNILSPDGKKFAGELFWDESVSKIMGRELRSEFSTYIKYPRTYHVPWSQPNRESDKYLPDMSAFEGKRVVVTEKMDGENTSMYNDHIHARSIDSRNHPSRSWVKNFHASIAHEIPNGYRICGESLYAQHTVPYNDLESFFLGFSIWNGNQCLHWSESSEMFELLGIKTVPVLYRGIYDEQFLKERFSFDGVSNEGWVIRIEESFPLKAFKSSVAKYVGKGFVLPHGHWTKTWTKNSQRA